VSGLRPRALPTAEETAAVVAAYMSLQQRSSEDVVVDTTPVWRFSGRWYAPQQR